MIKKVLIVSDSHGRNENLRKVMSRMDGCMDMMIHLGDFQCYPDEIEKIAGCPVEMVRGNCDSMLCKKPNSNLITIEGHKIFITHGHQFGGGCNLELLKEAARDNGAEVVMFGHTHVPLIDTSSDVIAVNPGSVSLPRQEGHRPTYLVMNIREDGTLEFVPVTM